MSIEGRDGIVRHSEDAEQKVWCDRMKKSPKGPRMRIDEEGYWAVLLRGRITPYVLVTAKVFFEI
jgi:hypothetical protein